MEFNLRSGNLIFLILEIISFIEIRMRMHKNEKTIGLRRRCEKVKIAIPIERMINPRADENINSMSESSGIFKTDFIIVFPRQKARNANNTNKIISGMTVSKILKNIT